MKSIMASILMIAAALIIPNAAVATEKIVERNVEYTAGGITMKGYLAYDEEIHGRRPGVLVVHEWWGQNTYVRERARMLAKLGYTALALDMYGEGRTAQHPDDAGRFASEVMKSFPVAKERFLAAFAYLKKEPTVDPDRIAAIGYCFGGGVVLNMARQGVDLRGVASFHGSLAVIKPEQPAQIKAAVRVYNGADDKFSAPEQIAALKKEMADHKVNFQFVNYPGAKHGFTNPEATAIGKKFNMPIAYNAEADKKSWADMQKFLMEIFAK
ncbi:MAG: Dienelactone hydrolase family protein [Syntrophorhabdus sp. PtaU1.Bin153]|nr:MAG: Dienelactone hydrolase family protein [Syntrophorhabdus sp. PtaU1.Bin153]